MDIKPIRTEADYEDAVRFIEANWGAAIGTQAGDRLDILMTLVDAYEREHWPIDQPDPVEAILFHMEQKGISRKDLERTIGPRQRVSEILNRKRALTMAMAWKTHVEFGIPLESLCKPYELQET